MLLACCGLDCEICPVLVATRTHDHALKEKTALEWSSLYAAYLPKDALTVEDMHCGGCAAHDGALFIGCTACPMRTCCRQKGFSTCAECAEFDACEMLNGFFSVNPVARETLKHMRLSG